MSGFAIKLIAIITMTIDHIGVHLVTTPAFNIILRAIGRTALPLFCFIMAESYEHTTSKTKYFFRITGFALLLELSLLICYLATGENYLFSINIFLLLSSCLLCLMLFDAKGRLSAILGIGFFLLISITQIDYGIYGILLVMIFHFTHSFWEKAVYFTLCNAFFIHCTPLFLANTSLHFHPVQWFSLLSLIPIYYYNGTQGKKMKLFFYLYYPLSSFVLWGLADFVS